MTRQPDVSVYDQTYTHYLERLKNRPFDGREAVLGIRADHAGVLIPYFGEPIRWTPEGLTDRSGRRPAFADCVVLCRYLLMAPAVEPEPSDWAAYRDLPDAGPLTVFWADTVEGSLAKRFGRRADGLERACTALGAAGAPASIHADVCRIFTPLPKVPLLLVFNDADDDFPAAASLLFERRCAAYLDAESQAILGHRLVERLAAAG